MRISSGSIVALLLGALAVVGTLAWLRWGAPEASPGEPRAALPGGRAAPPVSGPERREADAQPAPGSARGTVVVIPAPEEGVPPAGAAGGVRMPLASKLAPEALSDVSHELLGAWDEAPDSSDPGAHRSFVVVVDPSIADRELERLARDIAARHRGAEVLDLRVYDSRAAAEAPPARDGGAARQAHLVAQVVRNDRLGYERITVRGRPVGP